MTPSEGEEAAEPNAPGDSSAIPIDAEGSDRVASAALPRPAAAFDEVEADLEERMLAAELAGRTTVADALARRLEAHRAGQAAGNVVPMRARKGPQR